MALILSIFNHKGGVGKTTLTYNLGWALAKQGQRVLMIDADPQCNLTEFVIGVDRINEEFIETEGITSIYDILGPIVTHENEYQQIAEYKFYNVGTKNALLSLVTGSIDFAELDADLGMMIRGVIRSGDNDLKAIYDRIKKIGENYDYLILDLSPSLSAINQLLVMFSDYFITPVFPGLFSLQALKNLGKVFRIWNRELSSFSSIKKTLPQFLGIVFQNFRPYGKDDEKETRSAKRFNESKKILNKQAISLAQDLNGFLMAINQEQFMDIFKSQTPFTIAEIGDLNQLKIASESENLPFIGLEDSGLNKYGLNTPYYREKRDEFTRIHDGIASGLIQLIKS